MLLGRLDRRWACVIPAASQEDSEMAGKATGEKSFRPTEMTQTNFDEAPRGRYTPRDVGLLRKVPRIWEYWTNGSKRIS